MPILPSQRKLKSVDCKLPLRNREAARANVRSSPATAQASRACLPRMRCAVPVGSTDRRTCHTGQVRPDRSVIGRIAARNRRLGGMCSKARATVGAAGARQCAIGCVSARGMRSGDLRRRGARQREIHARAEMQRGAHAARLRKPAMPDAVAAMPQTRLRAGAGSRVACPVPGKADAGCQGSVKCRRRIG